MPIKPPNPQMSAQNPTFRTSAQKRVFFAHMLQGHLPNQLKIKQVIFKYLAAQFFANVRLKPHIEATIVRL
jgi:hypothetical protein